MTSELFVKRTIEEVRNPAVDGTISNLISQPGRSPRLKNIQQSSWYNALADSDKEMVRNVMIEAVDESIFGMMAVLDGVREIDLDFEEAGYLELRYLNEGVDVMLNSGIDLDLHDYYNALTNPE